MPLGPTAMPCKHAEAEPFLQQAQAAEEPERMRVTVSQAPPVVPMATQPPPASRQDSSGSYVPHGGSMSPSHMPWQPAAGCTSLVPSVMNSPVPSTRVPLADRPPRAAATAAQATTVVAVAQALTDRTNLSAVGPLGPPHGKPPQIPACSTTTQGHYASPVGPRVMPPGSFAPGSGAPGRFGPPQAWASPAPSPRGSLGPKPSLSYVVQAPPPPGACASTRGPGKIPSPGVPVTLPGSVHIPGVGVAH